MRVSMRWYIAGIISAMTCLIAGKYAEAKENESEDVWRELREWDTSVSSSSQSSPPLPESQPTESGS